MRRSLITFPEKELKKLIQEARAKGLALATYVRTLVKTHQARGRAGGAGES